MGGTEGQSPGGFQRVYFCNDESMDKKFDYAKAIAELEEIAAKVENPETKLDDIDALVGRSKELLKQCREYLRTVKEKIDSLDKE